MASPAQLWGQRERQCLQKSKQIFKIVSLPASEKPAHSIPLSVDDFGFGDRAFLWRAQSPDNPPKCQELGMLLGVRCPKGQTSQASKSLLSSRLSKAPVSYGDTELQRRMVETPQPQPPGCSNSTSSFCCLRVINYNQQARFQGTPHPQQPQLT